MNRTAIDKDLLLTLLKESVYKCYLYDHILIEQERMEWASVARIFYYMQEALKYDNRFSSLALYNLDNEYNKKGHETKRLPNDCVYNEEERDSEQQLERGVRPDIILHNRLGTSPEDNILVLEFKTKLKNGEIEIPEDDRRKLVGFTHKQRGYNYFLGVFIRLNEDRPEYLYFQNGIETPPNKLRARHTRNERQKSEEEVAQ